MAGFIACQHRAEASVRSRRERPRTGSWYPSFLSDGQHFLFFGHEMSQPEKAAVFVGSSNNGTAKRMVDARSGATYAKPGYLLFWRDGTLMAQAFDERTLEIGGNPIAVTSAAGLNPLINQGLFSVSASGTLVFFAGVGGESELVGRSDRRADRDAGTERRDEQHDVVAR